MKYTIDDLLRVVEENKENIKPRKKNVNDVHQFIEELNIKEGSHRVRNKMVYKAYRVWGGKKSFVAFSRLFSTYFKPNQDGNFRYYALSLRAVELLNKVDNGLVEI